MSIAILAVFLLIPCMATAEVAETHCTYMMVTPSALSIGPGHSEEVTVTVLDKEKKPIAKHKVSIKVERPEVIMAEPKEVETDANGKAMFRLKGLSNIDYSPLNINFKCKEHMVSIHSD